MEGKHLATGQQSFLFQNLRVLLDARHPLYRLAERIRWEEFSAIFGALYATGKN